MDTVTNATGDIPGSAGRMFLHIVFASTSGHTEYVVDALTGFLKGAFPGWEVEETMAEKTQPQDLLRGDILVLASAEPARHLSVAAAHGEAAGSGGPIEAHRAGGAELSGAAWHAHQDGVRLGYPG